MRYVLPVAVIGIIAIASIFFFTSQKTSPETMSVTPTASAEVSPADSTTTSVYKEGTYEAEGSYVSPGGPRDVDVSVVLEADTIMDATFTGHATDPNSKRFQGEFSEGFKSQVVGKKIDEVNVTKVAGSSLTPKGFMDALEKIKTQAGA